MVERGKREDADRFAIARVEQLYPRPTEEINDVRRAFPNLKAIRWVQDEPRNMGPWPHYALNVVAGARPHRSSRSRAPASSSPSVGTVKRHIEEQKALLDRAFAPADEPASRLLMYFTDRGIEELEKRRGDEEVTLAWLAERLQEFTDLHPEFETAGRAVRDLAGPARRPRGLNVHGRRAALPTRALAAARPGWGVGVPGPRRGASPGRPLRRGVRLLRAGQPADRLRAPRGPAAARSRPRGRGHRHLGRLGPLPVDGGRALWAIPKGLGEFSLEHRRTGPLSRTTGRPAPNDGRSPRRRSPTSRRPPRGCRSAAVPGSPRSRTPAAPTRAGSASRSPRCCGDREGLRVPWPVGLRPEGPLAWLADQRRLASFWVADFRMVFGG